MNDFLHSLRNGQVDKQRSPKTRKTYDNSYQYNNTSRYHSYNSGYQNPRNPNIKRQPAPPGPMGNQLPPEDPGITLLADAIENLTHHVEILIKNQEYMSGIQERTADVIERQTFAIEHIVRHLRLDSDLPREPDPSAAPSYETKADPPYETMPETEPTRTPSPEPPPASMPSEAIHPSSSLSGTVSDPAHDTGLKTKRRVIRKPGKPGKKGPEKTAAPAGTDPAPLLPREEVMTIIHTMRNEGATYDQIAKHLVDLGQPTFSGRGEWHAQTIHRLFSRK